MSANLQEALKEVNSGDWSGARSEAASVAKAEPGNAKAQWYLAQIDQHLGNTPQAQSELATALALDPSKSFANNPGAVNALQNRLNADLTHTAPATTQAYIAGNQSYQQQAAPVVTYPQVYYAPPVRHDGHPFLWGIFVIACLLAAWGIWKRFKQDKVTYSGRDLQDDDFGYKGSSHSVGTSFGRREASCRSYNARPGTGGTSTTVIHTGNNNGGMGLGSGILLGAAGAVLAEDLLTRNRGIGYGGIGGVDDFDGRGVGGIDSGGLSASESGLIGGAASQDFDYGSSESNQIDTGSSGFDGGASSIDSGSDGFDSGSSSIDS